MVAIHDPRQPRCTFPLRPSVSTANLCAPSVAAAQRAMSSEIATEPQTELTFAWEWGLPSLRRLRLMPPTAYEIAIVGVDTLPRRIKACLSARTRPPATLCMVVNRLLRLSRQAYAKKNWVQTDCARRVCADRAALPARSETKVLCTLHQKSGVLEHVSDEGNDMQSREGFGVSFVIFDKPSATRGPGEGSFNDPAPRQEDEAAFGFRQFDHFQGNTLCGSRFRGHLSSVTLVDIRQFDRIARRFVNIGGKPRECLTISDIGGRHMQRKQVPKRVDRHVNLRATLALGTVITGAGSALRRRPQGAAVDNGRRRVLFMAGCQPQKGAQILRQGLKTSRCEPALRLLADRRPRRELLAPNPRTLADFGISRAQVNFTALENRLD